MIDIKLEKKELVLLKEMERRVLIKLEGRGFFLC